MIDLSLPVLEEIISIDGPTILVVENRMFFSQLIESLFYYDEDSEIKLFDKKGNNLKSKEVMLIVDVLDYELNTNAVKKMIYADLLEILNDQIEVKNEMEELMVRLDFLVSELIVDHYLELDSNELILTDLFKGMNVKVSSDSRTIYDKIMDIIELYKYIKKYKLLIFVNVNQYLGSKEYSAVVELGKLNSLNILLLETQELSNETNYIIDDDFFLYKR